MWAKPEFHVGLSEVASFLQAAPKSTPVSLRNTSLLAATSPISSREGERQVTLFALHRFDYLVRYLQQGSKSLVRIGLTNHDTYSSITLIK